MQPASVKALLRQVSTLTAPGSCFAADFVSVDLMNAPNRYVASVNPQMSPAVGALFYFGVDDPSTLLTADGWQVMSVKHPGNKDANFGRWVQPRDVGAGFFFVMAERPWASNAPE